MGPFDPITMVRVTLACDACGATPVVEGDGLCASCREGVRARMAARTNAERIAGSEAEATSRADIADAIRSSPKPAGDRVTKLRAVVESRTAMRVDGAFVDMQTARACLLVFDGLNEENRAKFVALPMRKMGLVAWKLVRGGR